MEAYRRIGACRKPSDVELAANDLRDQFGAMPKSVQMLLDLMSCRLLAGSRGIRKIRLAGPDLVFTTEDPALAESLFKGEAGTVRLPDARTIHWRPPPALIEKNRILETLKGLLDKKPTAIIE
jgi:transcription-repair coupling factor (superfamily II helicase)